MPEYVTWTSTMKDQDRVNRVYTGEVLCKVPMKVDARKLLPKGVSYRDLRANYVNLRCDRLLVLSLYRGKFIYFAPLVNRTRAATNEEIASFVKDYGAALPAF